MFSVIFKLYKEIGLTHYFSYLDSLFHMDALCKTLMNWSCGSIEVTKTKKETGKVDKRRDIQSSPEFSAQTS